MKKNIIKVDGFELAYLCKGVGSPCIVIGSSIYYPRTFSENLCSQLKLIFMDHRGFGKATTSFDSEHVFALNQLIGDIEQLRMRLDLNQITLIGHSGHGYIALEYAKKYPLNVERVVLIATSPNSRSDSFKAAEQCFSESVCPERKKLLAENLKTFEQDIKANPQNAFITRMLTYGPMIWYQYDFDASYLWKDVAIIPEMFDYVWGQIFPELDITAGLNHMNLPIFIALGRYDYWNPPHLWEPYRQYFSDLTIRIFEKSGHTPQYEQADDFDRELIDWIGTKKI